MFNSLRATSKGLRNITRIPSKTYQTLQVPTIRTFTSTAANMGVSKTVLQEGSGAIPVKGDTVTIEYTGFLKDTSKPDNKGAKYV
jgi:FK506-binding protein 1